MALHQIDAILWRSYMTSTSDVLWGSRKNQYYIEMPASDYETFFAGRAEQGTDEEDNTTFTIWLEPFAGTPGVARHPIEFEKKREGIDREGSWNINRQHLNGAYPLWQRERGPTKRFQDINAEDRTHTFLVIARDVEGRFHGRWIRPQDFISLPASIKNLLAQKRAGWSLL